MHAEGKKATKTSKAADNEREWVLYLNPLSKAITCAQFEIRLLFKIEASSIFVKACSFTWTMQHQDQAELGKNSGNRTESR